MKKCASCSKDLPDAALHCVFCGAKQAHAPAGGQPLAKTVMGNFSQAEMLEHMRKQGVPAGTPGAPRGLPPAPVPAPLPPVRHEESHDPQDQATVLEPGLAFAPPSKSGYLAPPAAGSPAPAPGYLAPPAAGAPGYLPPPPAGGPAGLATLVPGQQQVPQGPANAKTMFASGPPPGVSGPGGYSPPPASGFTPAGPGPSMGAPMGGPMGGGPRGPSMGGPMLGSSGAPMPMSGVQMGGGTAGAMTGSPMPMGNPKPMFGGPAPISAVPQYQGSTSPARAGRPIEPWKDGLRLMMFLWGGALLVMFLFPVRIDKLTFSWDLIANARDVKGMLRPLLLGATGLLAIVFAAMPLATPVRGIFALVLGLAGALTPMFLDGLPEWPMMTTAGGLILLIPGLLLRSEYSDALLPRVLVTLGMLLALLLFVVPQHGEIMLVNTFKGLINGPGSAHVVSGVMLGYVVMLILSLLVWLPAPGTGGSKILMWLFVVWPAIIFALFLVLLDDLFGGVGNVVSRAPAALFTWVGGAGGVGGGDGGGGGKAMMQLLFTFMAIPSAFGVLIGYGGATVLGKQLE